MPKPKDITGQKFGKLTAIKITNDKANDGCLIWECKCDCGNIHYTASTNLSRGRTTSCGCKHSPSLVGKRFGKLVVISKTGETVNENFTWRCKCDCGGERICTTQSLNLGFIKSCGCLRKPADRDITGNRYGKLIAIKPIGKIKKRYYWECICDCGETIQTTIHSLESGHSKSCGRKINHPNPADLSNQKFGRLTVIRYDKTIRNKAYYLCKCECGNEKSVAGQSLKSGDTVSCGCYMKENNSKRGNENFKYLITDESITKAKASNGEINGTRATLLSGKPNKNNKSGYCGVFADKGKWRAFITFKRNRYSLGTYYKIEDAISARKKAEEMLFEPFLEWYYEKFPDKKPKESA